MKYQLLSLSFLLILNVAFSQKKKAHKQTLTAAAPRTDTTTRMPLLYDIYYKYNLNKDSLKVYCDNDLEYKLVMRKFPAASVKTISRVKQVGSHPHGSTDYKRYIITLAYSDEALLKSTFAR